MDQESVYRLTARMFEAIDAPERWGAVIDGFRDLVGGTGAIAYLLEDSRMEWHTLVNLDPADLRKFQDYGLDDDWLTRRWLRPRGAFLGTEVLSYEELRKTQYYHDLLVPTGSVHACGVILSNTAQRAACLSIFRPEGAEAFDGQERVLLEKTAPHLLRAFDLASRFQGLRHELSATRGCLDGLSQGLIFLGADQRILTMNATAEEILRQAAFLRVAQRRLIATPSSDADALQRSLSQACGKARHGSSLALGHPEDGGVLRIMVIPLDEASGLARWAADARACVILKRGAGAAEVPNALLRQAFGLTEREAMLAAHLAEGGDLRSFATRHSLSINTVRPYLRSVFDKTGTHRQAELVRLLAGLSL
jgi:DNA-binding CsgD family transcriptional regulator